ncbi:MAG: methyltransferase domain-containing protein [Actinomycetota bacterium]|nr:methyltransferase domain-containing protein [Actinomycetota bacterium]
MNHPVNINWENYWSELPRERGLPVWDSDGTVTAVAQLPLFQPTFGQTLPVLDVGCGNGTQTAALAEHFPTVIGLDFAPAAIEHARALQVGTSTQFRQFDLADADAAAEIHRELGDTNIYLRGVLHQMPDDRRPVAAASLATLLGSTGHLFAVELTPSAGMTIKSALGQSPDAVPKLQRVFRYGLTPAAWSEGKLESVLGTAGIDIVDSGDITLHGTDTLPDGSSLDLPMTYLLARTTR